MGVKILYTTFLFFFYFYFLLKDDYRILLFSVKPQHESAIGIYISHPFETSLPSLSPSHPSRLKQSACLSFLSHTANSCLAIYFTHDNINSYVALSMHLTLSFPSPQICSLCLFLHCCPVNKYFSIIFPDFLCMHQNIIFNFVFLTSLCIIGTRFICQIRMDANMFLFMVE